MADMLSDEDFLTRLSRDFKLPDIDLAEIQRAAKQKAAVEALKPVATPTPAPSPSNIYTDKDGNVIQRQEVAEITAEPLGRQWIQDKSTDPTSLNQHRDSYNMIGKKLDKSVEDQDALVGRAEMARKPYVDKLTGMVDQYMEPVPTFKSKYSEMAEKIANEGMNEKSYQPPQEDMLTKAIYAFGPGLAGLALGEDAQLAGPTAQKQAHDLREKENKAQLDAFKARQNEGSKRQLTLKLLMDTEQEAFNRQQDAQEKRLGQAEKILSNLSEDESKRLDKAIQDRHELMKLNFEKGLISNKDYQDEVAKLQALQNQKEIAEANRQSNADLARYNQGEQNKRSAAHDASQEKIAGIKAKQAGVTNGLKPPTESMSKNISYYSAAAQALEDYNGLIEKNGGRSPTDTLKFKGFLTYIGGEGRQNALVTDLMDNYNLSPKEREAVNAELRFMAPLMRKESGAAINASEWLNKRKSLFGDGGMSANYKTQLGQARQREVDTIKNIIGNYGSMVPPIQKRTGSIPQGSENKNEKPAPKAGDVYKGHRFKGGNPSMPQNWEKL